MSMKIIGRTYNSEINDHCCHQRDERNRIPPIRRLVRRARQCIVLLYSMGVSPYIRYPPKKRGQSGEKAGGVVLDMVLATQGAINLHLTERPDLVPNRR
jgi:hypothetical protein